jgi:FkbM family methyltransferase
MLRYLDSLDSLRLHRHSGVWEKKESALIRKIVKPGWSVADIGAHIGYYTDILSDLVGPTGEVHSFEPNPEMFSLLLGNTKERKNVRLHSVALADKIGTEEFSINPRNSGDGCIGRRPGCGTISVTTMPLDVAYVPASPLGFIKMDTQGIECRILRGAEKTIRSNPAIVLMIEFYPRGLAYYGEPKGEFFSLLKGMGLRVYDIEAPKIEIGMLGGGFPDLKNGAYTNVFCFGPEAEIPA